MHKDAGTRARCFAVPAGEDGHLRGSPHEHKEPCGRISGTDITHVGAMHRPIDLFRFLLKTFNCTSFLLYFENYIQYILIIFTFPRSILSLSSQLWV